MNKSQKFSYAVFAPNY